MRFRVEGLGLRVESFGVQSFQVLDEYDWRAWPVHEAFSDIMYVEARDYGLAEGLLELYVVYSFVPY